MQVVVETMLLKVESTDFAETHHVLFGERALFERLGILNLKNREVFKDC